MESPCPPSYSLSGTIPHLCPTPRCAAPPVTPLANAAPAPLAAPPNAGANAPPAVAPGNETAATDGNNGSDVEGGGTTGEQVHVRCPGCNHALVLEIRSAASSSATGKRWYAISVGRQIGVFYGAWDSEFKHLVTGVPNWFARRFGSEAEAHAHFNEMAAAGKTWVHVPR